MPIFEEKLISPLALRFTQEHIRTTFRDGRLVDQTIREIKTKPGVGDYDLVIDAPFPNIEIIRWYQKAPDGLEPDADHWFTLDNRRLYCLQRVAAMHWPKRVACHVELLYAAPHNARQKDSSETAGRVVRVGPKTKQNTHEWDWRQVCGAVRCRGGHRIAADPDTDPWACDQCGKVMPPRQRFRCLVCDFDLCATCHAAAPRHLTGAASGEAEVAAVMGIMGDDKKLTIADLTDAPCAPSLLSMAAGLTPLPGRRVEVYDSRERSASEGSTTGSDKSTPPRAASAGESRASTKMCSPSGWQVSAAGTCMQ